MDKKKIIGFVPVMLGMLILNHYAIFPLFVFVPIFVFGIYVELVRVFQGALKSLIPILYDLGAISCIVMASYFFTNKVEAFSKNAIGISLFCLLGAIFIGSGTYIRNSATKERR